MQQPVRTLAASLTLAASWIATAALPAAAQEEPQRGGTLIFALPGDPQHLNIAVTTNTTSQQAATHLFSTLVRVNKEGELEGDLAESWEQSEDGLTYTFHLRDGITWHDGTPLTADDVRWALEEINMKYNPVASTGFAAVESIKAPDEQTLEINLSYPFPAFMPWSLLSQWIYPRHIYEGTDPTTNERNYKEPVGTGPFQISEWVPGSHIVYQRNPNYYKDGMPYLDRLVANVIPDAAARVIALEQGEVDYLSIYALPTSAVPELEKNEDVTVYLDERRVNHGTIMAHLNLRNEYLQDKRVRQALYHAVDRDLLVERAMTGLAVPGSSPIASGQDQWYNPAVRDRYPYDPEKAEQLLDEAGFERGDDGTRFSLRLAYSSTGEAGALQSAAEIMREQLRAVGIDLVQEPMDYATQMQRSHVDWDFDLSMGSYQTGPDPAIAVSRLYICDNIERLIGRNLSGYCNEELDKIFSEAARELDPARRKELYNEAQLILVEDLPALWLWDKFAPVAFRSDARGNLPPGGTHQENFDGVWLADPH